MIHTLCTDNDVVTVVFIAGNGMYYKAEPQGNIMLDVCKCIGVSLIYTNLHILCSFVTTVDQSVSENHNFLLQFAIKNRYKHRSSQYPKRQHWMDWAEDKYAVRFTSRDSS